MKKTLILLLSFTLMIVLAACDKKEEQSNNAPEIIGAKDEVTIDLGQTFNALLGVSASDEEDGDITSDLVVSVMPNITFTDGKLTPINTGDYYITYTVTDSKGEVVEAYTTLKVMPTLGEKTTFIDYEFIDAPADLNDFVVSFEETAEGTYLAEKGFLNISVTNNGEADNQAKLMKEQLEIVSGATYQFTIKMKASETVKMHYIINNAANGWAPYAGTWNMEVTSEFQEYTLEFLAEEGSTETEFLLQFGGNNYHEFTNPEQFDIVIDSIIITKTTGEMTEEAVVEDSFDSDSVAGWDIRGDETYDAEISVVDGALDFVVNQYPAGNNAWEMDLYRQTGYDLVQGEMYKITFDYATINDQFYELCFEDATMDWQVRAGFKNGTLQGNGQFEYTFVASTDITDLHIKFSLGKGAAETNTLSLDNFNFYHLTGDLEEEQVVTDFVPAEGETPWNTFNNTEEGAEGVVYAEDGKLIYDITSFGTTDWFNKLYFENIELTGNGLYTLEMKIKADKEVKALTGLNVMGKWDPRVWEEIIITEEEQTFEFQMDDKLMFNMNFELLFQAGFADNEGPAKIEFSSIKILRQE
jgi:hypothetical protein